jgi:hypothetical protein
LQHKHTIAVRLLLLQACDCRRRAEVEKQLWIGEFLRSEQRGLEDENDEYAAS